MTTDEKILKITDLLEEASMLYYHATRNELYENTAVSNYNVEKMHTNFYECLIKIINYFLNDEPLDIFDDEQLQQIDKKIEELKQFFIDNKVNSEEVRRASLLLDIKGFKNVNFPLDYITPDATAILVSMIVKEVVKDQNNVTILDMNFGVGNLAFTVANHIQKNVSLVGFDNHELMARVAATKANMIQIPLDIFYEDALNVLPSDVDIVISDLACYDYENSNYHSKLYDANVRYFPYLVIEHYLKITKKIKYLYLIDNDFFSQKGSLEFKELLEKNGNILCLIALPETFFQKNAKTKSILILDNKEKTNKGTEIFVLPPLEKKDQFLQVMNKIKECIK